MTVRLDQIEEILDAVLEHVERTHMHPLFDKLTRTQAFHTNISFQQTVIRLRTAWSIRAAEIARITQKNQQKK